MGDGRKVNRRSSIASNVDFARVLSYSGGLFQCCLILPQAVKLFCALSKRSFADVNLIHELTTIGRDNAEDPTLDR